MNGVSSRSAAMRTSWPANRSEALRSSAPGHEPGLGEDLEAVADPEHEPAVRRERRDRAHDRAEPGDDPGPHVVAVGEAARAGRPRRPRRGVACSCHRATGSAPARARAWSVSRSQLLPGKTTTPIRTRHAQPAPAGGADGRRGGPERLDRVGLDERVRQQLGGEPVDDRPGRRLVGGVDGQLDPPSDPDVVDAVDPEVAEAALDRPTLRDRGCRAWGSR